MTTQIPLNTLALKAVSFAAGNPRRTERMDTVHVYYSGASKHITYAGTNGGLLLRFDCALTWEAWTQARPDLLENPGRTLFCLPKDVVKHKSPGVFRDFDGDLYAASRWLHLDAHTLEDVFSTLKTPGKPEAVMDAKYVADLATSLRALKQKTLRYRMTVFPRAALFERDVTSKLSPGKWKAAVALAGSL